MIINWARSGRVAIRAIKHLDAVDGIEILSTVPTLSKGRQHYWAYDLVDNWTTEDFIHDILKGLNSGTYEVRGELWTAGWVTWTPDGDEHDAGWEIRNERVTCLGPITT